MDGQIQIQTERLILKSVTPSIIHNLFSTKTKTEILNFFGFGEASYARHLQMHELGMETDRISLFFFLLINKQTLLPIGDCGFHTWNATHRKAELFYNIYNEENKRHKFMTEALPEVINYGFATLNLHRIQGLVDPYNIPSKKLLLKNGFTKEGILRQDYNVNDNMEDSVCYSLLQWEWQKS